MTTERKETLDDEDIFTEEEKKYLRWVKDKVRTDEFLDEAVTAFENVVCSILERDVPKELKAVADEWEDGYPGFAEAALAMAESFGFIKPEPANSV